MQGNGTNNLVLSLDRTTRVQQLNDWVLAERKAGHTSFDVYIKESRTYSNVCAPIAGVIEHYRNQGIRINIRYPRSSYVRHTRLWNPLAIENCVESEKFYPFDKVWTFSTSEGVSDLVSAYVLELRKNDIMQKGVIESIEWCLNEVMDNVLQHSNTSKGYIMAQIHKQSKIFAFCVFDAGIGIYNSLKNTKHHPEKAIDAITLALQERITRDEKIGQGNGLWGLSTIVSKSKGKMEISSGGARYLFDAGAIRTTKEGGFVLSSKLGTSFLDVRLSYSSGIDIANALTSSDGNRYQPIDIWLENLENENNQYIIKVAELASGTGTRQSAEKLRNIVLNISNNQQKIVVLDFQGVNLISSSFADELVGKIIAEKGFVYFAKAFRIANLSEYNTTILNRSVGQRMAQIYFESQLARMGMKVIP